MQLRRDDALAFLRRAKARPITLGPHFGAPPSSSTSSTTAPTSAVLKGGDALLALGSGESNNPLQHQDNHHQPPVMDVTHSYLLSLVAAHVSVLKPSSTTTPANNSTLPTPSTLVLDAGARVHWITMPGSKPPLPHQLLQAVEVAIVHSIEQHHQQQQRPTHPMMANRRGMVVTPIVDKAALQELVLTACSLITLSSPPDVSSLITTLHPSTVFGTEATGYKTPTSFGAVPLVVLTGLGYYESVVQIAERHIGSAAPIRPALSELLAALPCALVVSETASLPPRQSGGVSSLRGGSRYEESSSTYNNTTSTTSDNYSTSSSTAATTSAVLYSFTFKLLCDVNRGGTASFFPTAVGNSTTPGQHDGGFGDNKNTKPPYLHQSDGELRAATISLLQSIEGNGADEEGDIRVGGLVSAAAASSSPTRGRLSAQQQQLSSTTTTIPFQYVVVPTNSSNNINSSSSPVRIYSSTVSHSNGGNGRGSYPSSSSSSNNREVGVVLTPL